MTSRILEDEITHQPRLEIRCDTCGCLAPPATEIIAAFGLVRLGWYCSGGTHICAKCPHPGGEG